MGSEVTLHSSNLKPRLCGPVCLAHLAFASSSCQVRIRTSLICPAPAATQLPNKIIEAMTVQITFSCFTWSVSFAAWLAANESQSFWHFCDVSSWGPKCEAMQKSRTRLFQMEQE